MADDIKSKKMADDKLTEVVGGEINWGNGYHDGKQYWKEWVKFVFNVGDRVETWRFFGTERGTIIDRRIERFEITDPAAYFDHYFLPRYLVRIDKDGSTEWYDQDYLSY